MECKGDEKRGKRLGAKGIRQHLKSMVTVVFAEVTFKRSFESMGARIACDGFQKEETSLTSALRQRTIVGQR